MNSFQFHLYFIKVPSYITACIPFLLITGPFLPDLAISVCSILFLINHFFESKIKYFKSIYFKFFVIFWITLLTSSLFSSDIFYSLKNSFFYIRFGIFSLSVWYLLNHNPKLIKHTFLVFILSYFLLILDGYIQFFTLKNIFGWEIIGTRVSSFFKDELILGSYLSRLFPLAFALYIFLNDRKYEAPIIIIFILIEVLIFLSGERAAFLYLNMSAFFMILLSKGFGKIRFLILVFSIIIVTLITVFFNPQYKERILDKTIMQITANGKINIFSIEHENHYKSALLMFKDNPILGKGPKMFRKHCDQIEYKISSESCTTHPHNTYIQLLSEGGIFSFLQILSLFLFLIYYCFKHLYFKFIKKTYFFDDFQLSLLSAAIITLWPIVPTGSFFTNWLSIVYYLPVGFILFSFHKLDKKNNLMKTN